MNKYLSILCLSITLVLVSSCGGDDDISSLTIPVNPPTSAGNGNNGNSNTNADSWLIPAEFVIDGGPGKDGIPALEYPNFVSVEQGNLYINDDELVIGVVKGNDIRAYPHKILDWHEVVNDQINDNYHALSYCPLTGTALLWDVPDFYSNKTFGVSGLLYNSNLIMYDRETDSYWSQMLSRAVLGEKANQTMANSRLLEMNWGTWKTMYPQSLVLDPVTGFSRDYNVYPYEDYLTSPNVFFSLENTDNRLHSKQRVVGIKTATGNKVYNIADLAGPLDVINDQVGDDNVVIIGSSAMGLGIAYNRTLADGDVLDFTARPGEFPIALDDNQGNIWDIHGMAVSGPRTGQQLAMLESYASFWFAWVAMFPNPQIYGE